VSQPDHIRQARDRARKQWDDYPGDHVLDQPDQDAQQIAHPNGKPGRSAGRKKGDKPNLAEQLVAIARTKAELFRTPGADPEAYATICVGDHIEHWPVKSPTFRSWIMQEYFVASNGKVPGSQAVQDAINTLAGQAVFQGPEHLVAVRVAERDGVIWLDLCDADWHAVRIDATGWKLVTNPPIRFTRRRGMLPLPEPVGGGRLDELRRFVNLPADPGWILFVAWLVAVLRPGRPFPILVLNGEQGSAKSTLSRVARSLIDPNKAALRRPPRDERDMMIAACNSWIVGYDNLSSIPETLSDALCSLATGGSLATRELYTDAEEMIFDAMRPITINGITDVATRPDLLDRAIVVTLPPIPDEKRRDEEELWHEFQPVRPRILGALLSALSVALKNLPTVRLGAKPRMADFAKLIVAAEPALPWPAGAFLKAYAENRRERNTLALEGSLIAPPLLELLGAKSYWEGTATKLLTELEDRLPDDSLKKHRDWPKTARKFSGELRRIASNLRAEGFLIDFDRGRDRNRRRLIRLEKIGSPPSTPSAPSAMPADGGTCEGRSPDGRDQVSSTYRGHENGGKDPVSDDVDGVDGVSPPCSEFEREPGEEG
jgi:hypothetical protein